MTRKSKNYVIIALCITSMILAALVYISTNNSQAKTMRVDATYVSFSSLEKLIDFSDMIVIAKPMKEFGECTPTIKLNPDGRIADQYTVSPFEVKKVMKGEINSKTLDVLQPAATVSNGVNGKVLKIIGDYYTVMKKDKKYLLFLKKVENENFYSVISIEYGKYNLDGQDKEEKDITEKSSDFKKMKDMVTAKFKGEFDSVQ